MIKTKGNGHIAKAQEALRKETGKKEALGFISPSRYQVETFEPEKIQTYIDGLNILLNEKCTNGRKNKFLSEIKDMHKLLKTTK